MLFTQFNWDDALEVCREENYDEGHQNGLQEGLQKGHLNGLQEGLRQGICTLIETCQEFQIPREEALQRIIFRFQLDPSDAEAYMKQYWV